MNKICAILLMAGLSLPLSAFTGKVLRVAIHPNFQVDSVWLIQSDVKNIGALDFYTNRGSSRLKVTDPLTQSTGYMDDPSENLLLDYSFAADGQLVVGFNANGLKQGIYKILLKGKNLESCRNVLFALEYGNLLQNNDACKDMIRISIED